MSKEEIAAVVDEAHRRNARVALHSRGAGSTKAAAEAGVDWIMHADLATEAELWAVAEAGVRVMPTMTFLFEAINIGKEKGAATRRSTLSAATPRAPARCWKPPAISVSR